MSQGSAPNQDAKAVPTTPCPVILDCRSGTLHDILFALASLASTSDAWWHHRDQLAGRLHGEALSALLNAVRAHLSDSFGAVVIRMRADTPPDCIRLLQVMIGEALGNVLTISPDAPGRPLFKISAVEGQGQTGSYKGNAKKRESIGLHTDGSGVTPPVAILSMACIRPARRGGESRVVDARTVHARMSREALQVLESPLPRENPYRAMEPGELVAAPVFDPRQGNAFSYHPTRVRNGIVFVRGVLSTAESDALAELDARLDEHATELLLDAGDILMLDNRRIAHDRRPFTDDADAPRLLERLWIGRESTAD